jgi:rhamnose transport system substrate-binding protein
MKRLLILAAGMILLAVTALLDGCSREEKVKIGLLPKLIGIEYFNACELGAREAAAELGVDMVFDGPTTNDTLKQSEWIDNWIAQKYDVICVAPNDPDAIAPAIRRAVARGIPVITWDADANPEKSQRMFLVNQADNEAVGRSLVKVMAREMGPEGKVVIVTGSLTAANQRIWIEWMRKEMAENYPGMEELPIIATEEDQELAFTKVQKALKANPDLKGIFGITSVSLPGAAEAVRSLGLGGKVVVTGLGLPNTMRTYVKDDTCKTFILWNPVDLGYLTVYAAKMIHDGTLKLGITEITAGRLGSIEIRGDEILLGPPKEFNKENIDDFDF